MQQVQLNEVVGEVALLAGRMYGQLVLAALLLAYKQGHMSRHLVAGICEGEVYSSGCLTEHCLLYFWIV